MIEPVANAVISEAVEVLPRLREARTAISRLEVALQTRGLDVWEDATPQLHHAAGILSAAERALAGAAAVPLAVRAELKTELQHLARDIRRLDALMRAAAEFYSGWTQLLCAALGSYSPAGAVVAFPAPARLSLRG